MPPVFSDTMHPTDVVEGKLGDGYFVSALACLAEKPELVHKLIETQEYSDDGLYKVKICKDGNWVHVALDDYFPCSAQSGGMAIFSRSSANDLWVLLLEKAYAKLHLNYYTLKGGFVSEALQDLTGAPTKKLNLNSEGAQADLQSGKLFLQIEQDLRNGYVLAASTEGEELWSESKDSDLSNGLLRAHAYSVIDTRRRANGQRLIKVRNVWRTQTKWAGQYAEGSPDMTDEVIDELDADFQKKDFIWMSEQEFGQNFASLTTCMILGENYESIRFKAEFLKDSTSQG